MDEIGKSLDDLMLANRVLYAQGVVDSFGHVSMRHPTDASLFLISRSLAPCQVTVRDIQIIDFDGNVANGDDRPAYLERFIHGSIYRSRADVMSVVHSHSPSVIPFGVSNTALRPIYHMSGFLGSNVPVFEIRKHAGEASDMLIRDSGLGDALARDLDGNAAVLMRGHGATVVGTSLPQAVFRAVYTEINAKLQLAAALLGDITFLNADEAVMAAMANDKQIKRAWDLWVQEVGGASSLARDSAES